MRTPEGEKQYDKEVNSLVYDEAAVETWDEYPTYKGLREASSLNCQRWRFVKLDALLKRAIKMENYEEAARLRDKIRATLRRAHEIKSDMDATGLT